MYGKSSNGRLKHWDFILLDFISLELAYVISILLRVGSSGMLLEPAYVGAAVSIAVGDLLAVFLMNNYKGIMRRDSHQEVRAVCRHVIAVSAFETVYLFLSKRADEFSRVSFIAFIFLAFVLVFLGRTSWRSFLLRKGKLIYSKQSILILTTSHRACQVIQTVLNHTYNELEIMGVVLMDRDDYVGRELYGVKVVTDRDHIFDYLQTKWVDGILVGVDRDVMIPQEWMLNFTEMGIAIHTAITITSSGNSHQQLERLGGYTVLSTTMRVVSRKQLFLKRVLDICGGLVGCLMTLLITIFVGPAIYIASPGPIFFSQTRVGRNGRKFKIYKFRSMYMDAEERKKELMAKNKMQGFMFKMDADPRIIGSGPDGTRHGLGWFIRKTSLDEFPQFWNVLKGEMSLVGTRPPTVDEWEKYEYHHRGRMATKPGVTGMWQVSGRSNITDFEEVVRLDKEYIQNWNIWLDIKILLKTVLVVFASRGAE